MASLRVRRRRKHIRRYSGIVALVLAAALVWWTSPLLFSEGKLNSTLVLQESARADAQEADRLQDQMPPGGQPAPTPQPALPSQPSLPRDDVPTVSLPAPPSGALRDGPATEDAKTRVEVPVLRTVGDEGKAAPPSDPNSADELVTRRGQLVQRLKEAAGSESTQLIRQELARLGRETILSPRIFPGDPLVARYIVQVGDSLDRIAAMHRVSADFLARINSIADKNRIREGQTLKVVQGPFRAEVSKSAYTLDVYLGEVLVASYPVGLGAEDSTPTGEWRVGTKLVNPTYYPPRGGPIISADDPENPLGERWIALVGLSGSALGQERYGIHGTNEPDTIGKNLSMGCIRMLNQDVEELYDLLSENHSTVIVKP